MDSPKQETISFKDFIENFGRSRLCKLLNVTRSAVHQWVTYNQAPRPATAYQLILLSQGTLTWEAIYRPFAEKDMKGKKIVVDDPTTGAKLTFDFTDK